MSQYSLFQMYEPFRQSLIVEHLFYIDQARQRLLSQFDDIASEADKASTEWLEKNGHRFDPDRHDEASFLESAHDVGIQFYQLLNDMHDRTRLSVVAGMYHEWDKSLRKWLTDEIRHWHTGDTVSRKIWTVDFGSLAVLMESLGWRVRDQLYFPKLDACRLVVNVYKHGKGTSFNELKGKYPEYLPDPLGEINEEFSSSGYLDYTNLKVSDDQVQEISDAIVAFWKDVPEHIFSRDDLEMPDWFARAMSDVQKGVSRQQGGPIP